MTREVNFHKATHGQIGGVAIVLLDQVVGNVE